MAYLVLDFCSLCYFHTLKTIKLVRSVNLSRKNDNLNRLFDFYSTFGSKTDLISTFRLQKSTLTDFPGPKIDAL